MTSFQQHIKRMTRLKDFVAYLHAREDARKHPGHSGDHILDTYKFCNIRRSWDRTSKWLMKNWYRPNRRDKYLGQACAVARFVCWPDSLNAIGYRGAARWDMGHFRRALHERKRDGEKVFTGAYIISGGGTRKGGSKIDTVAWNYLDPVMRSGILRLPQYRTTCEALYRDLSKFNGWGAFMIQEVIQDMIMSGVLQRAPDARTFALAGPGAMRGLGWLYGASTRTERAALHFNQDKSREAMSHVWTVLKGSSSLPQSIRHDLTVHDIEFNLCEFDKYMRTLNGLGRPRSKYVPTQGVSNGRRK